MISPPSLHSSSFDAVCSHIIYEATYFGTFLAATIGWSLRTLGRQNIPASGPALLIANHQSIVDPVLIGLATRRHLCYMARKTLFKQPFVGWVLRMLNGIELDQIGVAKEGLKSILEQLERGKAVALFPEGERTWKGGMQALKPGIHLLIKRSRAAIVPVGIAGAYDAWPRWRKYPEAAPLFMPPGPACLGISIGKAIPAEGLLQMPRPQMLEELYRKIDTEQRRAEAVRRKP